MFSYNALKNYARRNSGNVRSKWCLKIKNIQQLNRLLFAHPVAQLVERLTPGSESPGSRRSGARYMKLLTGMARLVGAAAASYKSYEWDGPCPALMVTLNFRF